MSGTIFSHRASGLRKFQFDLVDDGVSDFKNSLIISASNKHHDLLPNEGHYDPSWYVFDENAVRSSRKYSSEEAYNIYVNAGMFPMRRNWSVLTGGVRHQGINCDSCYAHSTSSVGEVYLSQKLNNRLNLSAQMLMDCMPPIIFEETTYGGCSLGLELTAWSAFADQGQAPLHAYPYLSFHTLWDSPQRKQPTVLPYTESDSVDFKRVFQTSDYEPILGRQKCRLPYLKDHFDVHPEKYKIDEFRVLSSNYYDVMMHLAFTGPLSIVMRHDTKDLRSVALQPEEKRLAYVHKCDADTAGGTLRQITHASTLMGYDIVYDAESGKEELVWLIQDSYGDETGDNGILRLRREELDILTPDDDMYCASHPDDRGKCGECGIFHRMSFPVLNYDTYLTEEQKKFKEENEISLFDDVFDKYLIVPVGADSKKKNAKKLSNSKMNFLTQRKLREKTTEEDPHKISFKVTVNVNDYSVDEESSSDSMNLFDHDEKTFSFDSKNELSFNVLHNQQKERVQKYFTRQQQQKYESVKV